MKLDPAFVKCLETIKTSTDLSTHADNTIALYEALEHLMAVISEYQTFDEQLQATMFCMNWIREFLNNKC